MRRQEKALAKSMVKIRGFDVMLTEKVMFCIVAIPTMWFFYGMWMYFFSDFDGPTMALCIMSIPLYAYIGIVVSEFGMVHIKDLRPYYMHLFPSSQRRLKRLPEARRKLQTDLRAFINALAQRLQKYNRANNWIGRKFKKNRGGLLLRPCQVLLMPTKARRRINRTAMDNTNNYNLADMRQ